MTQTTTPTDTPSPTPLAYLAWPAVLTEGFTTNTGSWWVGQNSDDFADQSARIERGEYLLDITAKQGVLWRITYPVTVSDFVISIDARQITGPDTAEYGLVFRYRSDEFYYYAIGNSYYSVSCFVQGSWINLIDRTIVPGLSTKSENIIKVVGDGDHFLFFINDELMAELEDDHLSSGEIGLAVSLFENDQATFTFDNFDVNAP